MARTMAGRRLHAGVRYRTGPIAVSGDAKMTTALLDPQQWQDAVAELIALQAEYVAWAEALPDTLQGTVTADAWQGSFPALGRTSLASRTLTFWYAWARWPRCIRSLRAVRTTSPVVT